MNIENVMETLCDWIQTPVEKPYKTIKPLARHKNSFALITFFFCLSYFPMWRSTVGDATSLTSFRRDGSLMALGTQPFVMSSMIAGIIPYKLESHHKELCGFLLSIMQATLFGSVGSWLSLATIAYIIMESNLWLKHYGSMGLSTGLICVNASIRFMMHLGWSSLSTTLVVFALSWITECNVKVPVVHRRARLSHSAAASLPVMYNNTSAYVVYISLMEWIIWFGVPYSPLLLSQTLGLHTPIVAVIMASSVHIINKEWYKLQNRTGYDMVIKWQKQKMSIRGWRSIRRSGQFVEKIIIQCVNQNTILLMCMWFVGLLLQPSIPVTTIMILVEVVQEYLPKGVWHSLTSRE